MLHLLGSFVSNFFSCVHTAFPSIGAEEGEKTLCKCKLPGQVDRVSFPSQPESLQVGVAKKAVVGRL